MNKKAKLRRKIFLLGTLFVFLFLKVNDVFGLSFDSNYVEINPEPSKTIPVMMFLFLAVFFCMTVSGIVFLILKKGSKKKKLVKMVFVCFSIISYAIFILVRFFL